MRDLRVSVQGSRRSLTLHLAEWGSAPRASAKQNTIFVLKKAPLSVLSDLRRRGQSFVDIGRGHVRLWLPSLLIDREGLRLPPMVASQRALRDPFGDRASLISRALVNKPNRRWSTRELAAEVEVSTMTASHVIRQLNELGIVDVAKRGKAHSVRLRDVGRLVTHWTSRYDWHENGQLSVGAPVGNLERFLKRLPSALHKRRWALTLQAGASLVAPHATWGKVHVYVDVADGASLRDVAEEAGWMPGEGKLILLSPYYKQSVWYGERSIRGVNVVSDLQLVLDLWNYPVRGREQAEHVLNLMLRQLNAAMRSGPNDR